MISPNPPWPLFFCLALGRLIEMEVIWAFAQCVHRSMPHLQCFESHREILRYKSIVPYFFPDKRSFYTSTVILGSCKANIVVHHSQDRRGFGRIWVAQSHLLRDVEPPITTTTTQWSPQCSYHGLSAWHLYYSGFQTNTLKLLEF